MIKTVKYGKLNQIVKVKIKKRIEKKIKIKRKKQLKLMQHIEQDY